VYRLCILLNFKLLSLWLRQLYIDQNVYRKRQIHCFLLNKYEFCVIDMYSDMLSQFMLMCIMLQIVFGMSVYTFTFCANYILEFNIENEGTPFYKYTFVLVK
jgi:hypothetical protein